MHVSIKTRGFVVKFFEKRSTPAKGIMLNKVIEVLARCFCTSRIKRFRVSSVRPQSARMKDESF